MTEEKMRAAERLEIRDQNEEQNNYLNSFPSSLPLDPSRGQRKNDGG
jgi:hypothetical protein